MALYGVVQLQPPRHRPGLRLIIWWYELNAGWASSKRQAEPPLAAYSRCRYAGRAGWCCDEIVPWQFLPEGRLLRERITNKSGGYHSVTAARNFLNLPVKMAF
jgi:hypothetical protein